MLAWLLLPRVEWPVVEPQAQLVVGSTTGTMWSDPISFQEGELGTAWGEFAFTDTETASDLKYTIQYLDGDTWTDIPDSALSGNTAGFDTSPVSLLGVDKTLYPEIRIEANFTNSGSSPSRYWIVYLRSLAVSVSANANSPQAVPNSPS